MVIRNGHNLMVYVIPILISPCSQDNSIQIK